MNSLDDILQSKADSLDLQRGDQLAQIQEVLNALYPGKTRAKSLQDGVLTITTPSSSVANDVRLRENELLEKTSVYGAQEIKVKII